MALFALFGRVPLYGKLGGIRIKSAAEGRLTSAVGVGMSFLPRNRLRNAPELFLMEIP